MTPEEAKQFAEANAGRKATANSADLHPFLTKWPERVTVIVSGWCELWEAGYVSVTADYDHGLISEPSMTMTWCGPERDRQKTIGIYTLDKLEWIDGEPKSPCSCSMTDLLRYGCNCGGE